MKLLLQFTLGKTERTRQGKARFFIVQEEANSNSFSILKAARYHHFCLRDFFMLGYNGLQ